ncbi:hypothetical protein HYT23_05940 [Candidatus Pacearchaeota archaeon]|nr:hypothetical protein [Candidatus Pacearchaeota archaeon]
MNKDGKKHLRNFLIGTSILGALTISICSGERPTDSKPPVQTNEIAWLKLHTHQCGETTWQRDKRENPQKYANSYTDLEDIYWHYDVYGKVPLKRIVKELYLDPVCLACGCPDRDIFYIEVPESKVDSLIAADGFVRHDRFDLRDNH